MHINSLAILLTVFNRREGTLNCLRQLFAQLQAHASTPNSYLLPLNSYLLTHPSPVQVDVWLTDDGCTDGTPEAVSKEFPSVHIVAGDGSLYWNRGMIAAWQAAAAAHDYDGYLWLNDDTFLLPDALSRLLQWATRTDGLHCLVGSTFSLALAKELTDELAASPSQQSDGAAVPPSLPLSHSHLSRLDPARLHAAFTYGGKRRRGGWILPSMGEELKPCDMFNGNIVFIPRPVYRRLGTMDARFHHGIGDFDYGLRARKAGLGSLIAPGYYGACDLHERPATWSDKHAPLRERWKNFHAPTGAAPYDMFVYRRRHFGLIDAASRFCSSHIHVLVPWMWRGEKVRGKS